MIEQLLEALNGIPALATKDGLPDVPNAVLPAGEIFEMLDGWLNTITHKWLGSPESSVLITRRLRDAMPVAAKHYVVGL